jgi:CspA family cold shock protein
MDSKTKSLEAFLRNDSNILKAKLKWFNAAKGFGFVVPEENPVDAFLHITQLQKLGLHGLGDGAEILCTIDRREKGAVVEKLIEVLNQGTPTSRELEKDETARDAYKIKGIVKLYSEGKGFGFISPYDGMKDVFVHKSCLVNSGIEMLYPGQRVRLSFKIAEKGREAIHIEVENTP